MQARALVLLGDVVASRRAPEWAAAWLDRLAADLNGTPGRDGWAPLVAFRRVRGDRLEGVIKAGADPFRPVLVAALRPEGMAIRWAIVAGPAGRALRDARFAVTSAQGRRDRLVVRTGATGPDDLLDDLAPAIVALLRDLTPRQREIAAQLLLSGRRQSEVAASLGVSRATISVAVSRGGVQVIDRLLRAARTLVREGQAAAAQVADGLVGEDPPELDVPDAPAPAVPDAPALAPAPTGR